MHSGYWLTKGLKTGDIFEFAVAFYSLGENVIWYSNQWRTSVQNMYTSKLNSN